ncbi:MAG: transglycosylase domain-containing protein, partial [Gemmatimonadota bacterium]|nr:transglycosylase domain-containing protein [Gemmatimonadota bacterium]
MPPRRRRRRQHRRNKPRRSLLGMVLNLLTVLLLLGAVAGVAALAALWPRCTGNECPSVAALRSYSPPQASRVFDRNGELIAHLAPERRIVVPLEQIPAHVSGAFLAVEDKRFFRHGGVDYRRVVGATLRNARAQRYQEGFSTITMQLARNLFPDHLTREKTLRRKLQEIVLAREIEQSFSKAEIL